MHSFKCARFHLRGNDAVICYFWLNCILPFQVKNAHHEESLNFLAVLFVAQDFIPRFLKRFSEVGQFFAIYHHT